LLLKASERYEELYGLDIAPVCITSAQQLLGGLKERKVDLRVVNIDVEGLPFAEAYFDAVTMIAVLQLVFDVERAIREVHRVLRAKGTFIFETNNLAYIGHRLTLLLGRQPRTSYFQGWDGNVLHYFVLGPLVALLEREGFSVIKVCSAGRFSNIRSWRPSLFAQNLMIVAVKE
jgi:SAM-dependent methyltransferase